MDAFHLYKEGAETWTSMPHPKRGSYGGGAFIGSQLPHSGERFVGIIAYTDYQDSYGSNYREYLETRLTAPLEIGKKYCAQFYASAAARVHYASNNLAICLHNEAINHQAFSNLSCTPQIVDKSILHDSIHWVKIGGIITADSSYQYLTVGNFFADSQTNFQVLPTWKPPSYSSIAYYFIDDVTVEMIPDKVFTFSGDTVICSGKQALIQVQGTFDGIYWTQLDDTTKFISNSKSVSLSPAVTTSYRVRAKVCDTFFFDTVTVKVNPSPTVNLGDDRIICQGDSTVLDAGVGYDSYLWQNAKTNESIAVSQAGIYSVLVENQYNCTASDNVVVSVLIPPDFDLGSDVVSCSEFPQLKVKGGNGQQFLWSTGSTDSVMTPTHSGKYSLQISNQCGSSSDTINIYSLRDVFIPNVVTVNNDEKNEKLLVAVKDDSQIQVNTDVPINGQLKIYDTWGTQIFSDDNYHSSWPAVNKDLGDGVYYYAFSYLNCPTIKGWVQVVR